MMYMRPFEPFFRSPVPWLFQPGFGHNKSILYVIQCRHDIRNLPSQKHTFLGQNIPYLEGGGNPRVGGETQNDLKFLPTPGQFFAVPSPLLQLR